MLFEHDGGEERRFHTVRASVADDAAETALGGASARLEVVGQTIEVPLYGERRPQSRDQPSFAR
ncbi:MAG: hypothetical protein A3G76_15855 [Acidobacteria bacterium RIFCSPLOWO2_12_FULL_65_11]|nr:MAG: hypothetical protein A3H95_13510 [Acidobacteria bacterium RIFCSPLOWO2_02_FULL_64_15]OFW33246.1 MAG: hypothetical protein A3G76_15855 [Acidobacteria bacterium RIFCSPLOWO2_12_FULL_65_11]